MPPRKSRKERPPLDAERLNALALSYVGRFATTRSKLASYLGRKLRERGWSGDRQPELDLIVERLAGLGYVDDAAYALSKSRSLGGRGYGPRRVRQSLRAAGVGDEDGLAARELAEAEKVESALRFARRRRLGPFGAEGKSDRDRADRDRVDRGKADRDRALAAMIRAGHGFELSKAILSLENQALVDVESLREKG